MRDTFLLITNWASSLAILPFIQEEIPTSTTNKSFALPRLARRFHPRFQLGQVLLATNSTLSAVLLVRNLLKPGMESPSNAKACPEICLSRFCIPKNPRTQNLVSRRKYEKGRPCGRPLIASRALRQRESRCRAAAGSSAPRHSLHGWQKAACRTNRRPSSCAEASS